MKREKGFTLFIVIIFLMLVGLMIGVLGNMSKNFSNKTIANEIKVYTRQILRSGQAWAKENTDKLDEMKTGETISLDTSEFSAKNASCTVKIIKVEKNSLKAEISAGISKGRINTIRSVEMIAER